MDAWKLHQSPNLGALLQQECDRVANLAWQVIQLGRTHIEIDR